MGAQLELHVQNSNYSLHYQQLPKLNGSQTPAKLIPSNATLNTRSKQALNN